MIRHIRTFIYLFLLWVIVGVVGRLGFLAYYQDLLSASSFGEQALSLFYGLRLDMAVAGYLMLLPGLMLIVSLWYKGSALHWLWRGYTVVTAFLVGLAYVSNIGLYSYWGFPLDSTSLLYLRTSPADAMASLSWEQVTVALAAIILLTIAISLPMLLVVRSLKRIEFRKQKLLGSIVLLILTALLIIPIRILKSRDITLPTKIHLVKAMIFPVVMYGHESWTVKYMGICKQLQITSLYFFIPISRGLNLITACVHSRFQVATPKDTKS